MKLLKLVGGGDKYNQLINQVSQVSSLSSQLFIMNSNDTLIEEHNWTNYYYLETKLKINIL